MRHLARTTVFAFTSLSVGCFDPGIDLLGAGSTDDDTSESDAPAPAPATTEGSTSAAEPADESTGSGIADDTAGIEPDVGSTSEAGTTSAAGSSSEAGSSSDDGASSSGDASSTGEACGTDLPALLWVADADLIDPMELARASYLPGAPMMARTYAAEVGTVTFAFELACPATIMVHGLVWDFVDGAEPQNADSYYVSVDGLPEEVWAYGCVTGGLGDQSWSWQTLTSWTGNGCVSDPFEVELEAGSHEVTLRNREGGSGGIDAAAIAAIVITDDAALDPSTLYDPTP